MFAGSGWLAIPPIGAVTDWETSQYKTGIIICFAIWLGLFIFDAIVLYCRACTSKDVVDIESGEESGDKYRNSGNQTIVHNNKYILSGYPNSGVFPPPAQLPSSNSADDGSPVDSPSQNSEEEDSSSTSSDSSSKKTKKN